jgi:hypothetical protein
MELTGLRISSRCIRSSSSQETDARPIWSLNQRGAGAPDRESGVDRRAELAAQEGIGRVQVIETAPNCS